MITIDSPRLFVALAIPPGLATILAGLQDHLRGEARARGLRLHYPPTENLHVTLRFIGDFPSARLANLQSGLAALCARAAAPHSRIQAIDGFPVDRRARIIVARMDDSEQGLAGLAADCDRLVHSLGMPEEKRPYKPHITLARARRPVDLGSWAQPPGDRLPGEETTYTEVRLFHSTLAPGGSSYRVLGNWRVGASGD